MKRTISLLAMILSLLAGGPAFAGGGSASFSGQAQPLLAQVPSLAEAISKLSLEELVRVRAWRLRASPLGLGDREISQTNRIWAHESREAHE